MRIAILGESVADERVLERLIQIELGPTVTFVQKQLESRGWPSIRSVLPAIIRFLHYRDEADGLVVMADSNHCPFGEDGTCQRQQQLIEIASRTLGVLTPISGKQLLRISVAVPCPAIEAWLLAHSHPNINEAEWKRGLARGKDPYSKSFLKEQLYGVERPSVIEETRCMLEAVNDSRFSVTELMVKFPEGYGNFATTIRTWLRVG